MAGQGDATYPEVLKHYQLGKELGRGGMGVVLEGTDRRDGTRVAVKLLHPHLALADESFRERFEREAHVAALLRSPYTVPILDFGVEGGFYFLVMEFIEGQSLAGLLANGPIEPARALRIALDVARALEEAGARGVVHRDIKPENVLFDADGRVKVADFGIARQNIVPGLTTAGGFVGTAEYAAPEQALGESDQRSDIYALGVTLYTMLAGLPPFRGRTVTEILKQHQAAPVPMAPLSHLPDAVANIIRRCLEKNPLDRYQRADELAGAIERARLAIVRAGDQYLVARPPGASSQTVVVPPSTLEAQTVDETAPAPERTRVDRAAPAPTPVEADSAPMATVVARAPEPAAPAPTPEATRVSVPDSAGATVVPGQVVRRTAQPPTPAPAPVTQVPVQRVAEPVSAPAASPPAPPPERPPERPSRRGRLALIAGGAVAIAAVAGGLAFALGGGDDGSAPADRTPSASETTATGTAATPTPTAETATATASGAATPISTAMPDNVPTVTPVAGSPSALFSGGRAQVITEGCNAKIWALPSESPPGGQAANRVVATLCKGETVIAVTNTPEPNSRITTEGFIWWRVLSEVDRTSVGWIKEVTAAGEFRQLALIFKEPELVIDPKAKTYTAIVKTDKGEIVIRLDADTSPSTVNNFVFLARKHVYNANEVLLVQAGRLVQTGAQSNARDGDAGYSLAQETSTRRNLRGTVSMVAGSSAAVFGSQFVVNVADNDHLDFDSQNAQKFYPFGEVIKGLELFDAIARTPLDATGKPATRIAIISVTIEEANR